MSELHIKNSIQLRIDLIREFIFMDIDLIWAYTTERGFFANVNNKVYFAKTTNQLIKKIKQ